MFGLRHIPLVLAVSAAAGAVWWVLSLKAERDALLEANAALRASLSLATEYIETTKEVRHATDDLPDDPDAVLERLCELATAAGAEGGESCRDP